MALSSRRRTGPILRSLSPTPSAYSAFASSSSAFSSRSTATATATTSFFHRPTSPSSQSVRFSLLDRPTSPSRSISSVKTQSGRPMTSATSSSSITGRSSHNRKKQTCMCSPTTHPGSFRCSLHKNLNNYHHSSTASCPSNRLNARRSAMTNSLVRIGTVEGDLVRRALAALIRPSSHQQRRRVGFQPGRSRLSVMSKAEDCSR